MEQIYPEHWAFMHFGLIFSITCAQMLVLYVLSDSSSPPAGLGLFTVYFMVALLGWIAVTLQQRAATPMPVDIPALATIFNSYILFLAAQSRAGERRGRLVLGLICLAGCLAVFFLPPPRMFALQTLLAALFFGGAGIVCALRAWREHNVGDAVIACAALMMVTGTTWVVYQLLVPENTAVAQTAAFGVHGAAYALVAIGFLTSVLIEYQQHLSQLATEDPLTRLFNRRGLEDALFLSLAQAARKQLPTAAIMVDVDHLRQVNDSFGHETGDRVIQQVAGTLKRMSRATDVVARIGGEEFLLVLPDSDLQAARVLAERIREAVGERPLLLEGQRVPVTVSLGVASASGDVDLDDLTRDADRALSMAKRGGRNRVATVQNNPVRLSAGATAS